MIAIGNGEKCPWCDKIMNNWQIDGKDATAHFIEFHKKEFMESI